MINTSKRNERQYNWQKENRERINFLMDKGTKDRLTIAADKHGQKVSEYLREAIEEKLFRDGIEKKIVVDDPTLSEDQEPKK